MDALDRRILNRLQDLPLEANPYERIAGELGIPSEQLWRRVMRLLKSGVIRRMGFSIDSRKIGYSSTLASIRVAADRLDAVCELMSELPEVTHCYVRDDAFNIWFTVIAEDAERIEAVLERIRRALDLSEADMMNLPAEKIFKLDTRFKISK